MTIKRMPEHTGETWNELADRLAKQAAKTWAHPSLQVSPTTDLLQSRQALHSHPVRNFSPKTG